MPHLHSLAFNSFTVDSTLSLLQQPYCNLNEPSTLNHSAVGILVQAAREHNCKLCTHNFVSERLVALLDEKIPHKLPHKWPPLFKQKRQRVLFFNQNHPKRVSFLKLERVAAAKVVQKHLCKSSLWKALGDSGRLWETLGDSERLWETLKNFGRLSYRSSSFLV